MPALPTSMNTFGNLIKSTWRKIANNARRMAKRVLMPTAYTLAQPLPSRLPDAPPVVVLGHISGSTGLGEVARGSVLSLQAIGHPVSYIDIAPVPTLTASEMPLNSPLPGSTHKVNLLHVNAGFVEQTFRKMKPGFFKDQTNIGFWFWEMPIFPEQYYGAFSLFDEVWISSFYTQAAVSAMSPVPVVYMPCLVDPAPPAKMSRADFGLPEERFVFLFSFDACSMVERKNPWAVIRAFQQAFGAPESGPLLVVKLNNADLAANRQGDWGLSPDALADLVSEVQAVGGIILNQRFDRFANSALMQTCDCYISLHRCEGFGLTMAEAMYFGKPCIATGYSGNMDFMTPANSYPVGYRLVKLERNYGPFLAGDFWAEADVEQAAKWMQQVYSQPEEAAARGRLAAEDIRRMYSASAVGLAMQRRLKLVTLRKQGASAR